MLFSLRFPVCVESEGCELKTSVGEVYVLNDGGETDLDLGNYERYLNISLGRDNNVTTGKVYQHVIEREVRPGGSQEVVQKVMVDLA